MQDVLHYFKVDWTGQRGRLSGIESFGMNIEMTSPVRACGGHQGRAPT